MKKNLALFTVVLLSFITFAAGQQNKNQRPSPPAQAQCKFLDGKTITVNYSSPRMKGRKIFGGLVPYGQVWRTGANEATSLVTDANLTVSGKQVPAGHYTIFTIPDQGKWTLIINKKTGEWGIPYQYESEELGRVDMQVSKPPSSVENFTIDFQQSGDSCSMGLEWEDTRASVNFEEAK